MIFQQQQEDDDHHSPIDCQKVQGLIDLLREIHTRCVLMDQLGHINGILISKIFAMAATAVVGRVQIKSFDRIFCI